MKRLHIDSRLEDLKLHHFRVDVSCLGQFVYQRFEENALLPGVVLTQDNNLVGMISRRRFLEAMSRAYGRELFLRRSLSVLYRFIAQAILRLPGTLPIAEAAQQAIARSSDLLYEPIVVDCGAQSGQCFCLIDVHDVLQAQSAIHQLTTELLREKTRAEMMQTEKMASLGKMMAGVAHEIRNPVNFIWGNLKYISSYTKDLAVLVEAFDEEVENPSSKLQKLKQKVDVDFVLEDLSKVVQSIEMGTDRLRNLVTSLRTFARVDEVKRYPTDLHKSLDSTLFILNSRLKEGITIHKEYGDLPVISCYSGQIGQVFMNILSNAIDALLEYTASLAQQQGLDTAFGHLMASGLAWEPSITLITQTYDHLPDDTPQPMESAAQWISVRIQDNGPGIPSEIQTQVFEDFFTTKPAGEGTGLGLPITKQIVTEKHQGYLILRSPCFAATADDPGYGTEFEILLPVPASEQKLTGNLLEQPSFRDNAVNYRNPIPIHI
ncbi:MAG: ATP-binding protein [Cyanobacteria bacterium P01_F01_bin.86]